jgi:hypothetical protein
MELRVEGRQGRWDQVEGGRRRLKVEGKRGKMRRSGAWRGQDHATTSAGLTLRNAVETGPWPIADCAPMGYYRTSFLRRAS